ncbi:hypothetical protein IQ06DRAFT_69714 [Phaeosphaeriaceae sp. SRC1lsM3a]|nr:hypothetical protein IQ06DRAFT_69714 [Stagonospora sp. SRC1lsM3a]
MPAISCAATSGTVAEPTEKRCRVSSVRFYQTQIAASELFARRFESFSEPDVVALCYSRVLRRHRPLCVAGRFEFPQAPSCGDIPPSCHLHPCNRSQEVARLA